MTYPIYDQGEKVNFKTNVNNTFDHTKLVLENLAIYLYDPELFNQKYDVKIPGIEFSSEIAYKVLPLIAYLHDFYKVVEKPKHAEKGYEFISREWSHRLIQFHDIFGIVNTGEASLLYLYELFQYIQSLKANNQNSQEFLDTLFALTTIDVASYGFLNQSRIEVFRYITEQLQASDSFEDFQKKATEDTANRIIRLIRANNRVLVSMEIENNIASILREDEFVSLNEQLVPLRFDGGVYVLEPLFRLLCNNPFEIKNKDVFAFDERHFNALRGLLRGIRSIISNGFARHVSTVGGMELTIIDLNELSIKGEQHLPQFKAWANNYKVT